MKEIITVENITREHGIISPKSLSVPASLNHPPRAPNHPSMRNALSVVNPNNDHYLPNSSQPRRGRERLSKFEICLFRVRSRLRRDCDGSEGVRISPHRHIARSGAKFVAV